MKSSWWASTRRQISSVFCILLLLGVPETACQMVVHHAGGLHEGIAYGGTDKTEASLSQRLAHRVGFECGCRQLGAVRPVVADWGVADEGPQIAVQAAVLLDGNQCGAGVV